MTSGDRVERPAPAIAAPVMGPLVLAGLLAVTMYATGVVDGGHLALEAAAGAIAMVLTRSLVLEWQTTRTVATRARFAQAARRIYPTLAMVLVGAALYARTSADPLQYAQVRGDGTAALLGFANLHIHDSADYQPGGSLTALHHLWIVSQVMQFGLVWIPLVAWLLRRVRGGALVVAQCALALAAVCAAGSFLLGGDQTTMTRFAAPLSRMPTMFLGAAVGAWTVQAGRLDRQARGSLASASLAGGAVVALAAVAADPDQAWLYPLGLAVVGGAAAVVTADLADGGRSLVARTIRLPQLAPVAAAAWPIYAWSGLAVVWIRDAANLDGLALALAGTLVAVAAGIATTEIERPLREGRVPDWQVQVIGPPLVWLATLGLWQATAAFHYDPPYHITTLDEIEHPPTSSTAPAPTVTP